MIFHGGYYYYSETRDKRHIYIRRSRTIQVIGRDPGVCVWSAPAQGQNCDNLWAPELHLIDGRWFIYYAADDGQNENHFARARLRFTSRGAQRVRRSCAAGRVAF